MKKFDGTPVKHSVHMPFVWDIDFDSEDIMTARVELGLDQVYRIDNRLWDTYIEKDEFLSIKNTEIFSKSRKGEMQPGDELLKIQISLG